MKLDKKDLKPLHGARKNIKKVRKGLVTSGFFKKSGDIFFGATSQTKEKQPIGLFFLLSGYENDERGSLGQRSQNAMGMAFWQAVSSKARVLEERLAARAKRHATKTGAKR